MYGDNFYRCENVLTGQLITWFYDVDRNFDGNFDEKDAEVKYDLNFCILTSKLAFSCGNLLPSLCNDAGLLLLGEHSGGGSCAVAQYRTPEGFRYQISSARGRLINKENQNIDNGIEPQILNPYSPERSYNWGKYTFTYPGYEKFYDIPYLSSVISGN
jgi:hypothetical protein